jgi:hypothetical protein
MIDRIILINPIVHGIERPIYGLGESGNLYLLNYENRKWDFFVKSPALQEGGSVEDNMTQMRVGYNQALADIVGEIDWQLKRKHTKEALKVLEDLKSRTLSTMRTYKG